VIVQQERLEEDEDAQNAGARKHYSKRSRVSHHKDKPVCPRIHYLASWPSPPLQRNLRAWIHPVGEVE
jgi:hypothetical protein